jgi:hypothetical protein
MADLQTINQENRWERERLLGLMGGLKEADFNRRLSNGWTVTVTLAHLAFWDLRQYSMLKRWREGGQKPGAISTLDPLSVNYPLSILCEVIPHEAVVKLAADAAGTIDEEVRKLTPAQAEELIKMGLERNLHRALHRREHLAKIEMALK